MKAESRRTITMESLDENCTGFSRSTLVRTMRLRRGVRVSVFISASARTAVSGGIESGTGVSVGSESATADATTGSESATRSVCASSATRVANAVSVGNAATAAVKPNIVRRIKCIIAAKLQKLFRNNAICADIL